MERGFVPRKGEEEEEPGLGPSVTYYFEVTEFSLIIIIEIDIIWYLFVHNGLFHFSKNYIN